MMTADANKTNSSKALIHEETQSSNKLKLKDNIYVNKCFLHFISSFIS